jgi:ATP-dependent helicase HrpB
MTLPIDAILAQVLEALRHSPNVVVEAAPGAGKTTRVPPALLPIARQILVLEPRRIAARMAARRVASELGEEPGGTVGYQVRFEEVAGPATRLRFLTEGVLTRRLLSDPTLAGVDVVCLDEFHERHLEGDLALALLRRLQKTSRPDLKLVVMSATLDAGPVAGFLGDCPVLKSEGRLFETSVSYTPYSAEPVEQQAMKALESLLSDRAWRGDVLVFLPGAAEIRRTLRACEGLARRHDLLVLPLHGDLSAAEQDRAVSPAPRRKIILSTNVAESSITVEGVSSVIDSGTARVASDSPWTGLPTLQLSRIGKASAKQRAGRAGRTGPGRVIRLYTAEDFHRRAEHDTPEIRRRELAQVCLDLHVLGIGDARRLDWLDAPDEAAVSAAGHLLKRLGAVDETGRITSIGRRMARYPLHPRLGRLVVEAMQLGAGEDGCRAAAVLSSGARAGSINLMEALDRDWEPQTTQIFHHLRRIVQPDRSAQVEDRALERALLAAFPDRVARQKQDRQLLMMNGQAAELAAPLPADFLIALDVEDRSERSLPVVRLACPMEPELLVDFLEERNTVEWNRAAERVDAVSALLYGQLVVEENRNAKPDPDQAAGLLARQALDAGIGKFVAEEELSELLARISFASRHGAVRLVTEVEVEEALRELCLGLRSFSELKNAAAGLFGILRATSGNPRLLDELAPVRIDLPRRRNIQVHYALDKPPWIESRLQDFFGLTDTPRIARGGVALVVHLLAPNRRPVQTTTDLAGFWVRLYPQVRKELARKYPRHPWPENPQG